MIAAAPVIIVFPPGLIFSKKRKQLWHIAVCFKHQTVGGIINRHRPSVFHGIMNIGLKRLNNKRTPTVISPRSSDSIYKSLQIPIKSLLGFHGRTHSGIHHRLISSGKKHMLVIGLKIICDLGPQRSLHLCHFLYVCLGQVGKAFSLQPVIIVMTVDDNPEVVLDTIIDDFLDSRHPISIYSRSVASGSMDVPTDRNSYRFESGGLHRVNQLLSYSRIVPLGLCIYTRYRHLKRIAKVPSRPHKLGYLCCPVAETFRWCRCAGEVRRST